MKFNFAQPIGPLTLADVRALFCKLNRNLMTYAMIADAMTVIGRPLSRQAIRTLIEALIAAGYLVVDGEQDGKTVFQATDAVLRLMASKKLKRFDHKTGDKLVTDLLARVATLNADPHFPVCVARVRAFGSYIQAVDDLGDIDLVIDLVTRDGADLGAELAHGEKFGPRKHGFLGLAGACIEMAFKKLRAGDNRFSFHDPIELDELACPFKTVFQAVRADVPRYVRHPDLVPSRHDAEVYNREAIECYRIASFTPIADRNA